MNHLNKSGLLEIARRLSRTNLISKRLLATANRNSHKSDVVYLYQFPRFTCIPSISPYCLKLETWLRLVDVPYENAEFSWTNRSSEGTLPFVRLNGQEFADSSLAIRDLQKLGLAANVDVHLSARQRSLGAAIVQLVEQPIMMSHVYQRYVMDCDVMFEDKRIFPPMDFKMELAKKFGMKQFFKYAVKKRLDSHGLGKHPPHEIINIGVQELINLSTILGHNKYILNDLPCSTDASVFGVLAQLYYLPFDSPLQKCVKHSHKNLAKYCERLEKEFWPDWKEATEKHRGDTATHWKSFGS